jgi:hypothetical protein
MPATPWLANFLLSLCDYKRSLQSTRSTFDVPNASLSVLHFPRSLDPRPEIVIIPAFP